MLLKELSEAIGVSGDESAVHKIIIEAIRDHVTDMTIDSMGNLIAVQQGTGDHRMRVMLAAHMDEIGFMVTGYDSNGSLRFTAVGGVDARILPGLRVKVGAKALPGVIMTPPIHLNRDGKVKQVSDLRIDIGVTSKSAAEGQVKVGERVGFDSYYDELGDVTLRGKAFDDRVGCSLLVDVLQAGPYPVDVIAAFTTQEEIGLRGAQVAANRMAPDMALVLEGTSIYDLPQADGEADDKIVRNPGGKMGDGPLLTVMDRSMITPPKLLQFLRDTADKESIPYQLKTALGGGQDGGQIHLSNAGVPSAVINVPCRYIHTPTAYLNRNDYAHTLALVRAALNNINPQVIQQD